MVEPKTSQELIQIRKEMRKSKNSSIFKQEPQPMLEQSVNETNPIDSGFFCEDKRKENYQGRLLRASNENDVNLATPAKSFNPKGHGTPFSRVPLTPINRTNTSVHQRSLSK